MIQGIPSNWMNNLRRKCFNADSNVSLSKLGPDEAYSFFLGIFKDTFRTVFPFMGVKRSIKFRKRWVTQELPAKINVKNLLHTKICL